MFLMSPEDVEALNGASCAQVDPELFFPGVGGSIKPARLVCSRCHVLEACRERILDIEKDMFETDIHGIVAGMSPNERKKIMRENRAVA